MDPSPEVDELEEEEDVVLEEEDPEVDPDALEPVREELLAVELSLKRLVVPRWAPRLVAPVVVDAAVLVETMAPELSEAPEVPELDKLVTELEDDEEEDEPDEDDEPDEPLEDPPPPPPPPLRREYCRPLRLPRN